MTPYYADDLVTIWHGDCRDVLPNIAAAVLITDPPYGIGWSQHGGGHSGKARGMRKIGPIVGDEDVSLRDEILAMWAPRLAVVFGSFQAAFPADVCHVLIHRKTPDAGLVGAVAGFRRDAEPVFLIGPWQHREPPRSSVIASTIGLQRLAKPGYHPHVKPVDVLSVLIEACPAGTIVDPFMGSGSTLVAAKHLNRRSIGIEIEERYCEIAARRCSQEVLGLPA